MSRRAVLSLALFLAVMLSPLMPAAQSPIQSCAATPKPSWDANAPQAMNFDEQWQEVPDIEPFKNSYRWGWEQYLRHVAEGAPLRSPMLEGAKDVQLTELCYQSDRERRWVDVPKL